MALNFLPVPLRVDVTSFSTSNVSATSFELKDAGTLIVYGTPATGVFLAPNDMADGQQLLIVNSTSQVVNVMDTYTAGTTTVWVQGNSTYLAGIVASDTAQNVAFVHNASGSNATMYVA